MTGHVIVTGASGGVGYATAVRLARQGYQVIGVSRRPAGQAGLEDFTRSLARDLGARGITVNCVAPGFLATEMTGTPGATQLSRIRARSPMGRFAGTEEVAGAIAYLLSPGAGGLTGTVVTVDAGATA